MAASPTPSVDPRIDAFVECVLAEGVARYRDFPWRHTRDPYAVLVSEVMLQQTQAPRVVPYFEAWLDAFPTLEALAAAPLEPVLRLWQGLGYNRRAVALKRLAEQVVAEATTEPAELPSDHAALVALPGVGPATAAGVRAFAFNEHGGYLETNVRTVVLHELFADASDVHDRAIAPIVTAAAQVAAGRGVDARTWNFALLDYGVYLKRSVPNPSRRSVHHTRQSRFEGSRRQLRAQLLRLVMASPGLSAGEYDAALDGAADAPTSKSSRPPARELLDGLVAEGFLLRDGERYFIA